MCRLRALSGLKALRGRKALEVSPGVPGIVSWGARAWGGQEFTTKAFQRGAIVHVVPRGKQVGFQADFPGALQRLLKHALCAPVDLLEEPFVLALQAD